MSGYCDPCAPPSNSSGCEIQSEVQRGCAVASADASALTIAAAEVLSKLEFERALTAYGAFDTSTGLVIATAGRSASVHAALLASAERESIRRILVVEGSGGGKMAWALENGIREQEQARVEEQNNNENSHMMSHAGVTAKESAEWSSAIRGTDAPMVQSSEDRDWAALQSHLGLPEAPVSRPTVAVDVMPLADIVNEVLAGKVHAILVGADSVDPSSGAALLTYGCDGIPELAEAARSRQQPVPVVVLSLAWAQGCDSQGRLSLPAELRSRLVGLSPKQDLDSSL